MKKITVPILIVAVALGVLITFSLSQNNQVAENAPRMENTVSNSQQSSSLKSPESNQTGGRTLSGESEAGAEPQATKAQETGVNALQNALKDTIKKVKPSVVLIEVTVESDVKSPFEDLFNDPFFKRFFGEPPFEEKQVQRSLGSGFTIDFEGSKYIVTNRHVVHGATEIRITAPQGRTFKADIVGSDSRLDVAILKPNGNNGNSLPAVTLGESKNAEIGDWVIAIGNPLGLKHTVTWGIISALDRDVPRPDENEGYFRNMIQTDAAVNFGNSGGPLINMGGEVVGINTAIARASEGINFAIPIDSVKKILPQLIHEGKVTRAWIGVGIQDLTPSLATKFGVQPGTGVLISQVYEGSPAEKAGLKQGDIVLKIDGEKVSNMDELQQAIMYKDAGQAITITLLRDGQEMTLEATLAKRPEEPPTVTSQPQTEKETEEEAVEKYGIQVKENSNEIAEKLGLQTAQGVVVIGIEPGSEAAWAGLKSGDVILEVNGQKIQSVKDWNKAVSQLSPANPPVLFIMRGGQTFYLSLD